MEPILHTVAGNPENQDRGLIIPQDGRMVICIADGAGGRSGGTEAAVMAMDFIRQNTTLANNARTCVELLRQMDVAISNDAMAGETTCVLAVVTQYEVFGASVGDSGAWLIPAVGNFVDLTQAQPRKPFVGSGHVLPAPFRQQAPAGSLLLATDGLLKYTSAEKIIAVCRQHPADVATLRLVELVRYPSGSLPDDVTVIVGGF